MKINRKLWWIPIVGMIHLINIGAKNGFYENIENLKGSESLAGVIIHAISVFVVLLFLCLFILV